MRNILAGLFIIFNVGIVSAQHPISFLEEYIDFKLTPSTFDINGIYLFFNKSERIIQTGISFPFGMNTNQIENIRVYNLTYNKNIQFSKKSNGITFPIEIGVHDTIAVNIRYTQPTQKENKYIILSTKAWGKALEKAYYTLTVDETIGIESLSLSPDSISNNTYYWKKQNFMP